MQETQETLVQCLGQVDLLEKEMATYSKYCCLENPGQKSLVGYSPWEAKSRTQLSRARMSM